MKNPAEEHRQETIRNYLRKMWILFWLLLTILVQILF